MSILINQLPSKVGKTVGEQALKQWEASSGLKLPDDYRRFLLTFNGGMLKPWIFRHTHPEVGKSDQEMILDYLHDWETVLENSGLDTPRRMATRPPAHIEIGKDPGGGRILLSLQPQSHGNVVYWLPSHSVWGQEPNNVVGFIAPSFTAFLRGLFDDGDTEHGNWDVVARKRKPVALTGW
jgi:hypothetical protein